jgi:hypothetical protein
MDDIDKPEDRDRLKQFEAHNRTLYNSMGSIFENGLKSITIPTEMCQKFLDGLNKAYADAANDVDQVRHCQDDERANRQAKVDDGNTGLRIYDLSIQSFVLWQYCS